MPQIKYILLDCDNTLVQSERLAFEACADLTNEVLKNHGKGDVTYTASSLLEEFVGKNFRSMLLGLQEKYSFKMADPEVEDYVQRELGKVVQKLSQKCEECPGVTGQLEWLKDQKYPMAVVSTSAKPRVVASLEKTNLARFFPLEHVYSAATSLDPPSSKPDPAIYLHACKELGVKPEECVAVEDSKSGATAAMRAGIPLIAYVGIYGIEDGEGKMKEMAKTLTEQCKAYAVMEDWSQWQKCLAQVEAK